MYKFALLTFILTLQSQQTLAGTVGNFDQVKNLPGHIGLHERDKVYNPPVKLPKQRGDNIEHRTASRILHEDYVRKDGTIDSAAITRKILAIKNHENVAYLAYCASKLPKEANGHVHYCKSYTDQKIYHKWQKKKVSVFYRFAISELRKAQSLAAGVTADNINQPESQKFLHHLFQGLEVFESIKDQSPSSQSVAHGLRSISLKRLKIDYDVEAGNLIIPDEMKNKHPELQNKVFFFTGDIAKI